MVFEIPASKASIKQNLFQFKIPGEKKDRELPLQQHITADLRARLGEVAAVVLKHQKAETDPEPLELVALQRIQREVLEHYHPDLYQLLDSEQVNALTQAWGAASKASLGESSASAGS